MLAVYCRSQQVSPFQITLYCGGGNSLDAAPQAACGLIGPEWSARGNTSKLFHNNTWNKKDAPRLLGLNTSEPHPLPPVPPRPVRCVAPSPFSTQTGWPACKTMDKTALTVHNHKRLPSSLPTNNLRFLSFYGNGNAEEVTAADRSALLKVQANLIATNNLTVCKQAWHAEKLRCMLTVDWVWTHSPAALNASLVTEAAPLISSGGLAVLFLGDEPHVGSEANLARVANAARASLNSIAGGDKVLIYMNHCGSGLKR